MEPYSVVFTIMALFVVAIIVLVLITRQRKQEALTRQALQGAPGWVDKKWLREHERYYGKRYLPVVLWKVIQEIPEGSEYDNLRQDLIGIYKSAVFTAPEIMHPWWVKTVDALDVLGDPKTSPWKEKIRAIMAGTSAYGISQQTNV